MRGNIALVSLLAAGLLVGAGPASGQQTPPGTGLPEEVDGGVVVDLADGDRFKATVSRDLRTVWGSRYDAATGAWGDRSVVFREKDVFCGDVDARAAGTAVALIAECDEGGYSEDTAPTHSQALYSPDTLTWRAFTLPGEAYEEPGISPSGANAIWPVRSGWATYTAAGFTLVEREFPGLEYSQTATISDTGDVSVLWGGAHTESGECADALTVLSVTSTNAETRQALPVEGSCQDYRLANVDATTVLFGEPGSPSWLTTIGRPDTAAPWAVTGIPPVHAPGLVRNRGRGTAATLFASSPGLPLLAVGSVDRRAFTAQSYDPVAQRWAEPVVIAATEAECTWGDNFIHEPLGVFALRLKCGTKRRVLISTDAEVWRDVALDRRPIGASPDGAYVAVSNRKRTLIFSRERGFVRLPLSTRATCDVIQPVSPASAIRLTSTDRSGWPGRLEVSTATGWKRTGTDFPRLRVGTDTCRNVEPELYNRPLSYSFTGRTRAVSLTAVPRADGWRIKRSTY